MSVTLPAAQPGPLIRPGWADIPPEDVDRLLGDVAVAARDSLLPADADLLRRAIATDHRAWDGLAGRAVPERVVLRASEGTPLRDVLRVLMASVRTGSSIDVSLSWPLSDRLHRALQRVGADVRVETVRAWGRRVSRGGHRLRVVGPRLSRSTVLRRAMVRPELWAAGADTADVDLVGAGELERLAMPAGSGILTPVAAAAPTGVPDALSV
ncbi:hypothetical protein [Microbacterium terrisoli]|uniref:hypothetical protein n=1 Tax=Microbacterium terrisoli TaxID=3242192 RepID=UPI002805A1EC|nr:hypothetical protein [Microbacterium protaetiae]